MFFNRGRWIVNLVLVLALGAFVGFSTIPLIESALSQNQPSAGATSVPSQNSSSDLSAQAKGYELVLQREPENQTALRGLLEVRLQLGDFKGSIEPLEKLASLNPDRPEYMVLLAQAKQKLGDREGASQAYHTVLSAQPGEMNALQGLVNLRVQSQHPEAAIELLQDTLKTATQANQNQPGSVDVTSVLLLLAQVYFEQNRYPEAIAIYDEAIKGNQQDFRPVLAKALVLQQQGKAIEAKPLFTTAISLAPAQYKDQIKQMAKTTPKKTTSTIAPYSVPSSPVAHPIPSP
ncbi:MAG: tetratricopeptide repeat protein [Chamaesiphon sp.]